VDSLRVLRMPEVMARTDLKKNTIYKRMKRGEFPQNFPIGGCKRTVGWLECHIEAYIQNDIMRTFAERHETP
jgi:prophage regulatory protein